MNKVNINVVGNLSPTEKEVFDILTKVRDAQSPATSLRVAGGWVRDKLLGIPSNDIDIMVDNISGEKFANMVINHLGIKKSPHVIRENPEKTKNVETAKVYLPLSSGASIEIDFVQARKEKYDVGTSRVPEVFAGTIEEDAFRRDLTINSLFYNIHTKQVEDKTGKGIQDLITGTMRAPGEPKQRFLEDPLRIFRVIRFAAKYNGTIDAETEAAMKDPEVISVLGTTSRERIGQEMKKMLQNPNPQKAIALLKETGLFKHLLSESLKGSKFENEMEDLDMDQNNAHHEFNLWNHTMAVFNNLVPMLNEYPDERKVIMLMAAITHDLGKLYRAIHGKSASNPGKTSYHEHENASQEITELLLKYLKFENDTVKQVASLARYHMQPHELGRGEGNMSAIRKFVRRMGEQSVNWMDIITLSTADAYSKGAQIPEEVVQNYKNLRAKMEEALIQLQAKEVKVIPILDGREIMQILNIRPGPHMKEITEFIASLRDDNPSITKEEAIERLKSQYGGQPEEIIQQANSEREKKMGVCCPQQLFENKCEDIKGLVTNNKNVEALSTLKTLKDEYGNDPKVARLTAIHAFNVLRKDKSLRDNDLLQYIFSQSEKDFLDPVLGAHTVGLLLLMETTTKPEVIMEIGKRASKLSPGLVRSVLDRIPKDDNKIRAELERCINESHQA